MQRRFALVLLLLCGTSCSPTATSWEETLPAQAGEWKRDALASLPETEAPELVRQLGLKRAAKVTYTGPAAVQVRVFEMKVATSAFELIQKWRQQDGLAVYGGPYFVIADKSAPPEAAALLAELSKQLK